MNNQSFKGLWLLNSSLTNRRLWLKINSKIICVTLALSVSLSSQLSVSFLFHSFLSLTAFNGLHTSLALSYLHKLATMYNRSIEPKISRATSVLCRVRTLGHRARGGIRSRVKWKLDFCSSLVIILTQVLSKAFKILFCLIIK